MFGKTHIATGITLTTLICYSQITKDPQLIIPIIGAAAVGAIMPDVDNPTSIMSKNVRKITYRITCLVIFAYAAGNLSAMKNTFSKLNINCLSGLTLLILLILYSKTSKHRYFTHRITALIMFSVSVYLIMPGAVIYFAIGYFTHLLTDLITKDSGIPFLNKKLSIGLINQGSIYEYMLRYFSLIVLISVMIKPITKMKLF